MNLIFLPNFIIYGTYLMIQQLGKCTKFDNDNQTKNYLFPIIWTTLNFLTGLSWHQTKDVYFVYLMIFLSSWLVIYLCFQNYHLSFFVLISSLFLTFSIMKRQKTKLLLPLFFWLMYASYLNYLTMISES